MDDLAERKRRLGRRRPKPSMMATAGAAVGSVLLVLGTGTASASPTLQSTGSSFAGVAIQQWVGQASTLYGLNINWQVTSSVIGLDDFAQNQVDFGASDIPYSSGQATNTPTFPYEYMPDVAGALAFMYNLTGEDGNQITNLILNAHTVEEIFTGKITTWDAPDIAALNPQLAGDLPGTTITPVYREDASGENYLLSDYLLHLDPTDFQPYQTAMTGNPEVPGQPGAQWPIPQSGEAVPSGYPGWTNGNLIGESGSDNVANYVSAASSNGAITYVETAYAKEHNEPVASLVNQSGNAVQPTSVNDATALEDAVLHADLTQDLSDVYTNPLPNAYPISAYSYLVTPCSPSLAAAQSPPTSCAANNTGTSTYPTDKGQTLGQFVAFLACAGQQKMALLGYSPLPPNLVQEDFDAIGRLNGGREPPPVSAATCKNPYVDGQTPLPGEPAVVGQAPGVPGGGAPVAKGAAGTSGVSNGTGAGHNGAGGIAGTAGGVESAAAAGTSGGTTASTSGTTAGSFEKVAPGPNKYLRADGLASAATNLLDGLSPGMDVALWCGVLAVVLGAPPLISLGWRRRRRRAAIAASTTPIRNG
jgi:ABC-type phosphate transport system substrate-binding protein